jgi:hypothetical protein
MSWTDRGIARVERVGRRAMFLVAVARQQMKSTTTQGNVSITGE